MSTFTLPDLGEGLPDAEIVEWHVKVGDTVKVDDPLVSMETAKAVVDVPSPMAGKIITLFGQAGDVILTSHPLVEYETDTDHTSKENSTSTTVAGKIEEGNTIFEEKQCAPISNNGQRVIIAAPSVRAHARQQRIDLTQIIGTGPNGAILMRDLPSMRMVHFPDQAKVPEGFTPLRGPRRMMAYSMQASAQQVVPVSIYDTAEVSAWIKQGDITVRLVEAVVHALAVEPALNAWYDTPSESICIHSSVHLGMAVDSPEGLFVPVLRDLDTSSREALRDRINDVKKAAALRSFSPETLKGATFTLSNFGKYAGQYASPIVVPPTVAILGVGRLMASPLVKENQVSIGHILPLSVSFDHRAVTGGEATRFLGALITALEKA